MMTREEAIERYEGIRYTVACFTGSKKDCDAVDMAFSTLRPVSREQVEKLWRGEWELVRRMAAAQEFRCSVCGANNTYYGHPEKFCADCGSAMTDEAVQMVMERLEALNAKD